MQKELKYNGYAAVPSDYECQDGDLAAVLGLIPDKGALHPVAEPQTIFTLAGNAEVLFVHETSKFRHFIILTHTNVDILGWSDSSNPTVTNTLMAGSAHGGGSGTLGILQINAIGNTLVVLTENGMRYFLWKSDSSSYLNLGSHLPELPIAFGLQGEMCVLPNREVHFDDPIPQASFPYKIENEADIQKVTDAAYGMLNKLIADCATNAGRFMFPFFVRYAFRLFDGSLVMHSAPVFMPCILDNKAVPFAESDMIGSFHGSTYKFDYLLMRSRGAVFDLDYNVLSSSALSDVQEKWPDIIKSVDIFISSPIYKYNQGGGNIDTIFDNRGYGDTMLACCRRIADGNLSVPKRYQRMSWTQLYLTSLNYTPGGSIFGNSGALEMPEFSDREYRDKIKDCAAFYLLKSIPVSELTTSITKIDVQEDYLQSLVNREVMDDDYDSHSSILPRFSYPYNSRLNVCDLSKTIFSGFNTGAAFCRTDGYAVKHNGQPDTSQDNCETVRAYVYLKKDGDTKIVRCDDAGTHAWNAPLLYYYYPDTDAYQAVFEFTAQDSTVTRYKVQLEPHTNLNGAFFYADGQSIKEVGELVATSPAVSANPTIEIHNKIYTSEVNNPFSFPLLGINTVGNGRIMAIASAAKALSQGQFGQFPMYAFSTDGVWALEVSATTGAFSGRQPITRDVCLNANSIGQIDSAVLFASDRGIMLLSGSNAQCITEGIDNNGEPFNFAAMPHASGIKTLLGITAGANDSLTEKPFSTFLNGCQILYAYNRQHIIVFNPTFSYAYVYSLESKQWGIIKSSIRARVPSYPQAYAMVLGEGQTVTNSLVDYSLENGISGSQFLLTRPLKLDAGAKDVLKTIDTIIQRGDFAKGHVQTILYGSRDLINWFTVFSSQDHYLRGFRGTPYKYYRIALVCSLTHKESIYGATVQFNARLTDQPR